MKYDLCLNPPLLNAAGSLGFAPTHFGLGSAGNLNLADFCAFITNPLSLGPRTPAQGARYGQHAGGFLLHTGYPNPGLSEALRRYAPAWSRAAIPVIVHLIPQNPAEAREMVRRLEGLENVVGVEIGLAPGSSAAACRELLAAAQGELPLLARLSLDQALLLAEAAVSGGADYISLGPARASLLSGAGVQAKLLEGRWYGPGVFPLALQTVRSLARQGLPVIGGGGVYQAQDVQALLQAGAKAVQLDSVLWKKGWTV